MRLRGHSGHDRRRSHMPAPEPSPGPSPRRAVEIRYTCEPSPDTAANEDFVLTGANFALVLDGATPSGLPTGCVHDVPWFVTRLAGQLGAFLLAHPDEPLQEVLRQAILRT